jgi:hypothetical protein
LTGLSVALDASLKKRSQAVADILFPGLILTGVLHSEGREARLHDELKLLFKRRGSITAVVMGAGSLPLGTIVSFVLCENLPVWQASEELVVSCKRVCRFTPQRTYYPSQNTITKIRIVEIAAAKFQAAAPGFLFWTFHRTPVARYTEHLIDNLTCTARTMPKKPATTANT